MSMYLPGLDVVCHQCQTLLCPCSSTDDLKPHVSLSCEAKLCHCLSKWNTQIVHTFVDTVLAAVDANSVACIHQDHSIPSPDTREARSRWRCNVLSLSELPTFCVASSMSFNGS